MEFLKTYWWIILVFIVIIYRAFKPTIKGFLGEKTVSVILDWLPLSQYMQLNDILLSIDGKTSQIDHIVVSVYGIFVIETKNYKGWIYGKEKDDYWVQNIYGKKSRFLNPIRQNYGHIQELKKLLFEYDMVPIRSIIAFSPECDLKVKCDKTPVLYFLQIAKYIKSQSTEKYISEEDMYKICDLISKTQIKDKIVRHEHIEGIIEKKSEIEKMESLGICPKCGKTLVERKGKYGSFFGCSGFPSCRYIKK